MYDTNYDNMQRFPLVTIPSIPRFIVTEYEIYHAMMRTWSPQQIEANNKSCLLFNRNIRNLDDNLDQRRAQKFTDVVPGTSQIETGERKKCFIYLSFV